MTEGMKHGIGPSPVCWPAQVNWCSFNGSTRSGLKIAEVTNIVNAMLQVAGFSETLVKASMKLLRWLNCPLKITKGLFTVLINEKLYSHYIAK